MAIRRLFWLLLIGLGLAAGCGRGSDIQRAIVSGHVTYQGKPIPMGIIRFVPDKGTKGPAAWTEIKDGNYVIDLHGGVPVGAHRVEIEAFELLNPSSALSHRPTDMQPMRQYLPDKYNRETTLQTTIESTGKQNRDFKLE